jgi:hypothetical protein
MKAIIVGIVLAGMALAETVYFGSASKAFHKTVACSARPGKPHQLHADRAVAVKHGLSECKRCWRAASAKSSKAGNGAWAEKAEAKEVK